jgi:DNA-damage-inducible protein J
MDNSVVRSRIDPIVKQEANRIFKNMGITLSDGIRLFLYQVIAEKALPFKVKMPNKKTIAAMEAARKDETEPTSLENIANEWNNAECEK